MPALAQNDSIVCCVVWRGVAVSVSGRSVCAGQWPDVLWPDVLWCGWLL